MFNLDLTCRVGGLIRPGRLFSNLSSKIIVVQTWFCYWCKHLRSGDLSDTLDMFVKLIENFPEAFEKKLRFWKSSSLKSGWNILTKTDWFDWNFFQRPLENILLALQTCLKYLKGPLTIYLCVNKSKSWDFEDLKPEIELEYLHKTRFFWADFF